MRYSVIALVILVMVGMGQVASGPITFIGPSSGTGLGFGSDCHNLMTLQDGNDDDGSPPAPTEWGSILWDGSADVLINARQPGDIVNGDPGKSATITFGGLIALGLNQSEDNFGLLLDVNEDTESTIEVHDFSLLFMDAAGLEQFRITYTAPVGGLILDETTGGAGDFDYLFRVQFDNSDDADDFYDAGNANWRVGMEILEANAIGLVGDGTETFGIKAVDFSVVIPEPSTLIIWSLLGALGITIGCPRPKRLA